MKAFAITKFPQPNDDIVRIIMESSRRVDFWKNTGLTDVREIFSVLSNDLSILKQYVLRLRCLDAIYRHMYQTHSSFGLSTTADVTLSSFAL